MGSPDEPAAAGKPPNPKDSTNSAAPATATATAPAPAPAPAAAAAAAVTAAVQEVPVMAAYPDWSNPMHAYYASGAAAAAAAAGGVAAAPAAFFPPAAWGGQMMTPYGTPIPYSPVYYAHPSMSVGAPYPNSEALPVNKAKKVTPGKSGDGGKATSGSGYDDATQSGDSGSEGSSATGEESANPKEPPMGRKRTSTDAFGEGESVQAGAQYSTSEAANSGRVAKLPVSAPGRSTLPGPTTNLNIGMEAWSASHAGAAPLKMVGPNALSIVPTVPGREGVMTEHPWIQMDERELKRERRKQSNRESARRSRMRKQQECEELAKKVSELSGENTALRVELEKVKKGSEELLAENVSLMVRLKSKNPDLLTEEEKAFIYRHGAAEGPNGSSPSIKLSIGEGSV